MVFCFIASFSSFSPYVSKNIQLDFLVGGLCIIMAVLIVWHFIAHCFQFTINLNKSSELRKPLTAKLFMPRVVFSCLLVFMRRLFMLIYFEIWYLCYCRLIIELRKKQLSMSLFINQSKLIII